MHCFTRLPSAVSKPALPEPLSRADSDRELASLQDERRMASLAATYGLKNTLMIRKAIRDYPGAANPLFTGALDDFRQRTGRVLAYDRDNYGNNWSECTSRHS